MKLPRGNTANSTNLPIATARWAETEEILNFQYKPGAIWLGRQKVAAKEALPAIDRLRAFEQQLLNDTALQEGWRDEKLTIARQFVEQLNETDEIDIGVDDDRHHGTFAGTRGGKGTSTIINNLCLYPGSVICIDPKGENARITASRRGQGSVHCDGLGQTVCVLDPYNESGVDDDLRASWNPLDLLDLEDDEIVDKASSIAEALFVRGSSKDPHFDENARAFVKALILYVAVSYDGLDNRNLFTVNDLLKRGAREQLAEDRDGPPEEDDPEPFRYLLYLMEEEEALDGVISGAATTLLGMGDNELGSVLSTARRNLEFLERRAMRRVLEKSTFDLDRIKSDPDGMTIYLCLPPTRMHDCGRFLRLMISAALERVYAVKGEPRTGHPILFLLEEFASLSHMANIENAAGYAAGFGLKLWFICQDLPQLKRHYKDGWETFIGNAGTLQVFSNSDNTTLEYLSKGLGEIELRQEVRNVTSSLTATSNDPGEAHRWQTMMQNRGTISAILNPLSMLANPKSSGESATTSTAYNEQIQHCPLLRPDEIERAFKRENLNQVVRVKGQRPIALTRVNYYDTPEFLGLFDPDRPPFRNKAEADAEKERLLGKRAHERTALIENAVRFVQECTASIQAAKQQRS